MKHLRLFEEKSYHYMADYIMPAAKEQLLHVIKVLNENYIPFDLYYYYPNEGIYLDKLIFKIYYNGALSNEEKRILKKLDVYYFDGEYEFTWPWEKTTEDNIQFLLDQQKYNL